MILLTIILALVGCRTVHSSGEPGWLKVEEVLKALNWSETMVKRMARLEENLSSSAPRKEPDKRALRSYILYRAARFLSDTHCVRFGRDKSSCAESLAKVDITCDKTDFACHTNLYRSYDGSCNDPEQPTKGAANTTFSRLLPPSYRDGLWEVNYLIPASEASDVVEKLSDFSTNRLTVGISAWSAFISADLAMTKPFSMLNNGAEIKCCDNGRKMLPRYVHPFCLPVVDGNKCINYVRSTISTSCKLGPAQQVNHASHYLDASPVYGVSIDQVNSYKLYRSGLIKIKPLAQCEGTNDCLLQLMITLMTKEHNRIASSLKKVNNHWGDELIFQESRKILIGEIQHITYSHWLPSVIGNLESDVGKGEHYNSSVSPEVINSFASAAIKVLTSGLSKSYRSLIMNSVNSAPSNDTAEVFFKKIISFNQSGKAQGLSSDEMSLLIQIGRDHGLASFADYRKHFNLPHSSSEDITKDISKMAVLKLKKLYKQFPKDLDLVVGGILEKPRKGSILGPVLAEIVKLQMTRTRDGDRFFYSNQNQPRPLNKEQIEEIRKTSFPRLICDNFGSIKEIQSDLFNLNSVKSPSISCDNTDKIRVVDLTKWKANY